MTPPVTAVAAGDAPTRTRVGSYVLVRRIGSGGTADVWLGRHAVSGGIAAVKVLDHSWPDVMRDLTELRAVTVTLDDQQYRLRTELRGCASAVLASAGIRPPRVCDALARA